MKSISRYGYCLTVLEIALEEISKNTLKDTLETKKRTSFQTRAESFTESIIRSMSRVRADSVDSFSEQGRRDSL